jgi:hypothetical protein
MKYIVIIAVLFLSSGVAFGDEAAIPSFSKKPMKFKVEHKVSNSEKAVDELLLGDITESNLTFWFLFIRTNYHICSMSGSAKSIAKNTYQYSVGDCNLRITIESGQATVDDVGGKCSHSDQDNNITSCGSRGYIGKTILSLVNE